LLLILAIVAIVLLIIPNVVQLVRGLPEGLANLQERAAVFLDTIPPNSVVLPIVNLDLEFILTPLRQLLTPTIVPPGTEGAIAPVVTTDPSQLSIPELNYAQIVSTVTSLATGLIGTITGLLSTAFLAIFLSLLVLLDLPNYQISVFNTIPAPYHREVRILMDRIGIVWRGFFRVQVTIGFLIGVLTALQLALMGAPEPVGLAVVVAIISLIPTIGGFFSLIPLAILPLISGSTVFPDMSNITFALLVVVVNMIWTQVIWNAVAPKIMGDAVALPLPVIIVGIGIGAALGGILGAFLIVPTAGTIRVLVLYIIAKINARDPFPGQVTPEMLDLEEL
jgi:predicted PurR-regulated permease PerM